MVSGEKLSYFAWFLYFCGLLVVGANCRTKDPNGLREAVPMEPFVEVWGVEVFRIA